jgi:hypothetical protein
LQEFRKAKSDLVVAAKDKEDAIYEQERELALQKMVEEKMAAGQVAWEKLQKQLDNNTDEMYSMQTELDEM